MELLKDQMVGLRCDVMDAVPPRGLVLLALHLENVGDTAVPRRTSASWCLEAVLAVKPGPREHSSGAGPEGCMLCSCAHARGTGNTDSSTKGNRVPGALLGGTRGTCQFFLFWVVDSPPHVGGVVVQMQLIVFDHWWEHGWGTRWVGLDRGLCARGGKGSL